MIIVVNTRLLIHNRLDGIGRFTYETLSRITRKQEDVNFVFLFDRQVHEEFVFSDNITPAKILPPARRPWLFNIWLNYSVHNILRDLHADLFLSPDGFLPLRGKTKCLPVIHDLNFEHYPEDIPSKYARWYLKKFPQFAQRATRIATVSEFSKQDISTKYNIAPEKIDVVYNAANEGFQPLTPEMITLTRNKWSQGEPYFLYVGSLHPRKNLERLVLAFAQFKKTSSSKMKLLVVGGAFWKNEHMLKAVAQVPDQNDVVFTRRVSETDLHALTGAALALTFVPYFEGFGIPLVEAMSCDIPIISADTTSLPEVAGNAALYCDPFSVDSIADAMKAMASDEKLRTQLVANGKLRRANFSWDKSADALWNSMVKTMNQNA